MELRTWMLLASVCTMSVVASCDALTGAHRPEYQLTYDTNGTIFGVDTDGYQPLASAPDLGMYDASWSPDGRRAVFSRTLLPDSTTGVFVLDLRSGSVAQIAGSPVVDLVHPVWSPAGNLIAYEARAGKFTSSVDSVALWVMNVDGTGNHHVGTGLYFMRRPSWSPDATRLAVTSTTHAVVVIDATSGARLDSIAPGVSPTWSPDGKSIAFNRDGLVRFDFDTRSTTTILAIGDAGYDPAWSPDGSLIAFEDGYEEIGIVRPDGTGKDYVVTGLLGEVRRPAWRKR